MGLLFWFDELVSLSRLFLLVLSTPTPTPPVEDPQPTVRLTSARVAVTDWQQLTFEFSDH